MKKSLVFILSVSMFLCAMISVSAEDHKHELHKIGERIKEAVKAGKITGKEGWAKWHAVLREHGEAHEQEHEGEDVESEEITEEIIVMPKRRKLKPRPKKKKVIKYVQESSSDDEASSGRPKSAFLPSCSHCSAAHCR